MSTQSVSIEHATSHQGYSEDLALTQLKVSHASLSRPPSVRKKAGVVENPQVSDHAGFVFTELAGQQPGVRRRLRIFLSEPTAGRLGLTLFFTLWCSG